MADLKAYTSVYSFPYPLPGDSVQNTYSRIQELAERIEATYTILGINLDSSTGLLQVGDAAGGALTGTYPNPTLDPNVALPDGITATTQAQNDNSTKVATTAYVDAYVAGSVPDGAIGTDELADGAVTNAKVAADAAIAYSKLDLTGEILEADLAFNIATQGELDSVASDLSDHEAATTSVHGIADTSLLETTSGAQSKADTAEANAEAYADSLAPNYDPAGSASAVASDLSTHEGTSTSVHGISNTADLVYTSDSRLSDARTPTAHAVSHESGGSDELELAPSQITGTAVVDSDSRLTDARTPTSHATSHESGGSDEIEIAPSQVTGTAVVDSDARLSDARTPTSHAASHESGGSDELELAPSQITGTAVVDSDARLTDARTPTAHASTHNPGQSDALDLTKIVGIGAALPTLPDSLYPAGSLFGVGSVAPYLLYRSTGSAWDQIGGAGGSSVTTDDTAPVSPSDGDLWYDSTTGKTFVWYEDGSSNQWVEVGTNGQLTIPLHGSDHVRGGSDIIDGDRLTVDYVPTNYTRDSAASGAGDVTDLTAHLAGINLLLLPNVVSYTKQDIFSTTSTSYTDVTDLSVTITPRLANSKILVIVSLAMISKSDNYISRAQILRNSTAIGGGTPSGSRPSASFISYDEYSQSSNPKTFVHLDSPNTTSATTYKVQVASEVGAGAGVYINYGRYDDINNASIPRLSSSITAFEIPII